MPCVLIFEDDSSPNPYITDSNLLCTPCIIFALSFVSHKLHESLISSIKSEFKLIHTVT